MSNKLDCFGKNKVCLQWLLEKQKEVSLRYIFFKRFRFIWSRKGDFCWLKKYGRYVSRLKVRVIDGWGFMHSIVGLIKQQHYFLFYVFSSFLKLLKNVLIEHKNLDNFETFIPCHPKMHFSTHSYVYGFGSIHKWRHASKGSGSHFLKHHVWKCKLSTHLSMT